MKQSYYEELVSSDFLGRDKSTYTKNSGKTAGWEKSLGDEEALSNYVLRINPKAELEPFQKLLHTKRLATSVVETMNSFKGDVTVNFQEKNSSYAVGNNVMITLEPLVSPIKFPTFQHRLDVILGYAVHEMAHINYTKGDRNVYLNDIKDLEERSVKNKLSNLIEDERIEMLVSDNFKGYAKYLGKTKEYVFHTKYLEQRAKMPKDITTIPEFDDFQQLLTSLIFFIRFPSSLDEVLVNKFENELRQFMDILKDYPKTTDEVFVATDKVYAILEDYVSKKDDKKEEQEDNQEQESSESGDGDESSDSSSSAKKDSEDDKKEPKGKSKPKNEKDDKKEDSEGDGSGGSEEEDEAPKEDGDSSENGDEEDSDSSGSNEGEDGDDTDDASSSEEEEEKGKPDGSSKGKMGKMAEAILDSLGSAETPEKASAKEIEKALGADEDLVKAINRMSASEMKALESAITQVGKNTESLFSETLVPYWRGALEIEDSAYEVKYNDGLETIKSYASTLRATMKKLNRNHEVTQVGLFEGELDTEELVSAALGTPNVYKQYATIKNQGAVIALLIDESGSMGGKRIKTARSVAIMFERALKDVNKIDFFCYGHSVNHLKVARGVYTEATVLNRYFEGRKKGDRKQLGKISASGSNRDGHAILEVVNRIRQFNKKDRIILFCVSDGDPSAGVPKGYEGKTGKSVYNTSQIAYTKDCIDEVEKNHNVSAIHIALDKGIDSASMFKNFVTFTDMSTLSKNLGSLLKVIIKKIQKPIIG